MYLLAVTTLALRKFAKIDLAYANHLIQGDWWSTFFAGIFCRSETKRKDETENLTVFVLAFLLILRNIFKNVFSVWKDPTRVECNMIRLFVRLFVRLFCELKLKVHEASGIFGYR